MVRSIDFAQFPPLKSACSTTSFTTDCHAFSSTYAAMFHTVTPAVLTAAGLVCSSTFATMNLIFDHIAIPSLLLAADSKSPNSNSHRAQPKPASSTTLILRQWSMIQARGHYVGPLTAVLSSSAYLAASLLQQNSTRNLLLRIAAVFAFSVVPFTVVVIFQVNDELRERSKRPLPSENAASGAEPELVASDALLGGMDKGRSGRYADQDDLTMLARWVRLNEIRAAMAVAAGVLALASLACSGLW
jgi:hypothetical protein